MTNPSITRDQWAAIQDEEFKYHESKDESKILDLNLVYWRELLGALPEQVALGKETSALDLGCGGCGILLALDEGRLVGVDPLMERYLEKFPFLSDRTDIRWIAGAAEEVDLDGPFDVVFSINALDHVYDPAQVAARIAELTRPGGHCVVTMNCHNTRFFRSYYSRLYKLIDRHHPYQFLPESVAELFRGFTLVESRDIDDLWLPYAERYYREALHRPFVDKRKWLKAARNPFKWPMGFCKVVLNMPPHKKKPGQRSIYSNYLIVLRRDGDDGPSGASRQA
jgi:2-polyprenyl-3-methyl-5-hydroxy-6-metoxy-1,4-benzoquinol methylase